MAYASVTIKASEAGPPTPQSGAQVPLGIGVCSLGVTGQAYTFGNLADMKAGLGHGHLVDFLQVCKESGGLATLYACPADDTSIAGTTSAVTQSGTGDPMTVTGTPLHDLEVTVQVLVSGTTANGLARVRFAVDCYPDMDPTWTSPITVTAGSIALADTGMSVQWPDVASVAAALVAGTTYKFNTRPAHYSSGGAPTALQVQSLLLLACTYLVYTGASASASGAATLATAIGTLVNSLANGARFVYALAPASRDTPSNVVTQFTNLVVAPLPFLCVGYGDGVIALTNPLPGRGFVRLQAHEIVAFTLLRRTISGSPARTRAGALPLKSIGFDGTFQGSAVHDARVATLKSEGQEGFFVGGAPLLHAPGSKINAVQHAAVLCVSMRTLYRTLFKWKNEGVRQNADKTLDSREVEALKEEIQVDQSQVLLAPDNDRGFPGHVSAMRAEPSTTTILPAMSAKVFLRLLGYPEEIVGEVVVE